MLTFALPAMPAIRKNSNIVTFKNAETGIKQTFYLTSESRKKFKDVGKKRRTIISIVKDRIDREQRRGVIDRSILWSGCTVLLWRIGST